MKNFNQIRNFAKPLIDRFNTSLIRSFIFAAVMSLTFVIFLSSVKAFALPPGEVDLSFNPTFNFTPRLDNRVIVQPDGKIIVGGGFTVVNGANYKNLVRLNTDGTVDAGFNPGTGPNNAVGSLALQSDGKILIGGGFTTYNGVTRNRIARLNSDGSLDTAFDPGAGPNSTVRSIALQPDGKVLVGGNFTAFSGSTRRGIVRLNSDGSLDSSFVTTENTRGTVTTIAVQTDGKILIGGLVSTNNLMSVLVVRLNTDGSLDPSFTPPSNPTGRDQTAFSLVLQPDGKILLGGGFYRINGTNQNGIARLNPNGSLDASFNVGTGTGENDIVQSVAVEADGKIIIGGTIISINGTSRSNIARLNADGSLDTTFITTVNSDVFSIALSPNGQDGQKIVISGDFSNVNGIARTGLARLSAEQVIVRQTAFDFDGDGKTDYGVFRPSNGVWYLERSQAGFTGVQFGVATDKLTPADYDGDGKTDVAVYRDGIWYLQRSALGFTGISFGAATDIAVPADYDGDGKADIAVFRPSSGVWYLYNLVNSQTSAVAFGQAGDKPVPADFDGDGKADIAVFRTSNGTWYVQRSQLGFTGIAFGISTDKLVAADYDGDGKADVAVARQSGGIATWYVLGSTQGFYGVQFGADTDKLVPGDYDGDGKTDIAVWRPGNGVFYVLRSGSGNQFSALQFGASGDIPVTASFVQ